MENKRFNYKVVFWSFIGLFATFLYLILKKYI